MNVPNLELMQDVSPTYRNEIYGNDMSMLEDDKKYFVITDDEDGSMASNTILTFISTGAKIKEAFKDYNFEHQEEPIYLDVYEI